MRVRDSNKKKTFNYDDAPYSEKHLWVFNNNYTTIGLKSYVVYDRYGRVLFNNTVDFPEMSPVVPDSQGDTYAEIAKCIAREGANKARERYEYVPYSPETLSGLLTAIGRGLEFPFETKVEPGYICANIKFIDDSYITEENKDLLVLMFNEAILGIEGIRTGFVEAFCGLKLYMYGPTKSLSALVANYQTIKKKNEE